MKSSVFVCVSLPLQKNYIRISHVPCGKTNTIVVTLWIDLVNNLLLDILTYPCTSEPPHYPRHSQLFAVHGKSCLCKLCSLSGDTLKVNNTIPTTSMCCHSNPMINHLELCKFNYIITGTCLILYYYLESYLCVFSWILNTSCNFQ